MKAQEFVVPGKVQAKQRPRFNTKTKHTYTPIETMRYERLVKQCYRDYSKHYNYTLFEGALRAEITAYMQIPKSKSKKDKERMRSANVRPQISPDADNICKSILDGLNGVAYNDDKQVVEVEVKKYYADEPRVVVKLIELEG